MSHSSCKSNDSNENFAAGLSQQQHHQHPQSHQSVTSSFNDVEILAQPVSYAPVRAMKHAPTGIFKHGLKNARAKPDNSNYAPTHNNLPTIGSNKHFTQFRNQINQQQQQHQNSSITPDVLNVNQQFHQQHDIVENGTSNTNYNNLNITTTNALGIGGIGGIPSVVNNQHYLLCNGGTGNAPQDATGNQSTAIVNNINSYNFDLNELKQPKTTTKMLQKSSTGGNKRSRQIREREQNNLGGIGGGAGGSGAWTIPFHDLNLASSTTARLDSKSSAKLFDDLKENVYLEVSALIAANESRPQFLINLFRDLQLISTSDPLRTRLLQAFKEVYSQYGESGPNVLPQDVSSSSNQVASDNRQTSPNIDYTSAESTPVVKYLHSHMMRLSLDLILYFFHFISTVYTRSSIIYRRWTSQIYYARC